MLIIFKRNRKGANGVEADVTFGRNGDPLFTYHGPPCDCWRHCHQREHFNDYLSYVREIAIDDAKAEQEGGRGGENQYSSIESSNVQVQQFSGGIGQNLSLLFLDLKLDYLDQKAKARAGAKLAESICENLFLDKAPSSLSSSNSSSQTMIKERQQFRLVISVNHVGDVELINNFVYELERRNASHLLDRIGFDVGMNDDLQLIETMWTRFGKTLNLWQGDGYTNCISPFYNLERLTKALVKRNQEFGYPRKVYQWTIDLHDRMRESLQLGVDAIMTNHPERLVAVLNEPDVIHNYRLATREDNPFEKISQHFGARNGADQVTARYQRSASPPSGGFFRGLMDVINSWLAYMKEIPFLSFPTTSRLIPRVKRHRQKSLLSQIVSPKSNSALLVAKRNDSEANRNGQQQPLVAEASEQKRQTTSLNNGSISLAWTNSSTSSATDNGLLTRNSAEERSSSTISDDTINSSGSGSVRDSGSNSNQGQTATLAQQPYEGPKWYTNLVSSVLVSMLKVALPV